MKKGDHLWDLVVERGGAQDMHVYDADGKGVRRMAVPGGHLYQVETRGFVFDGEDAATVSVWSQPVFVPTPPAAPVGGGS